MSWFRVDDALHAHPKTRKAGLESLGLWAVSGSYCMAYLTDGFVPEWFVKEKPHGLRLAQQLVDAGLWHRATREGEKGWSFHDWEHSQDTKLQVTAAREKARQRKAKQRESQGESRRDGGVTDGVSPASAGSTRAYPTQPNPTHKETLVTSSTEVTLGRSPDGDPTRRGTRLPEDWRPREAPEATAQHLPGIDVHLEYDKFCDHWRAQPGVKGRKTDWDATWRNWLRRAAEQLPRAPNGHAVGKPTQKALGYQNAAERIIAGMEQP